MTHLITPYIHNGIMVVCMAVDISVWFYCLSNHLKAWEYDPLWSRVFFYVYTGVVGWAIYQAGCGIV